MKLHAPHSFRLALAALFLGLPAAAATEEQRFDAPRAVDPSDLSHIALRTLARREGVELRELRVVDSARATYAALGLASNDFKVATAQGLILDVSLDEHGQEVDPAALRLREEQARFQRFGRIDEQLFVRLIGADEQARFAVGLWLVEPEFEGLERPDTESAAALLEDRAHLEALDAELARLRSQQLQQLTAPVLAQLLAQGELALPDDAAPLVYASLTAEQIRVVAGWDTVDRVYSALPMKPLLDRARQEILVAPVQAAGITGANVKIAQVEVGGRVALNFLMFPIVQDTTYVCATPSDHATAVAGILKSLLPGSMGISYGAQLFGTGSCSGALSELHNRTSAAMGFGARSFNLSFGVDTNRVPGLSDRFYDNLVTTRWRTMVVAAGNQGQSDGDVLSPGLAYNVITVGNYDMGPTTAWNNGWMNPSSSYRNPVSPHGDREKPDLCAPGTRIQSTLNNGGWGANYSSFPFTSISGTSFSAPMVTGATALMLQRNAALTVWPEAIKSILITSAIHNIEGAARLSERDGAGALNAHLADEIVRRVNGDWGGMAYNCSFPSDYDLRTVYVGNGLRMRASIAWDNPTNYAQYASLPSADLDLVVVNSAGAIVASSASWDSTTEIVDFVAPASGYYTIRVHKHRCDQAPRYLGWSYFAVPPIG